MHDQKPEILAVARKRARDNNPEQNNDSYIEIETALDELVDVVFENLPAEAKNSEYFDTVNDELTFFYEIRNQFMGER